MYKTIFIPIAILLTILFIGCDNSLSSSDDELEGTDIVISEVMAANTHVIMDPDFYNFSDYIELYNPTDSKIDMTGYKLSDKLDSSNWTFPEGTNLEAGEYMLIWADDKNMNQNAIHTNFKLNSNGDAIALFDKNGITINSFEFSKQLSNVSIRSKDGKIVYMNPTPDDKNSKTYDKNIISDKVTYSLNSGSYESAQTLTLSANDADIYYTKDGSIPTINSTKYSKPITINSSISIRCIATQENKLISEVQTNSYLIAEDINLPIMFLSIDSKYLYDDTFGIYTIGTNGKEIDSCGENDPVRANYMQDWERPAHLTMFENDKSVAFSQQVGIEIAGTCSRTFEQKAFKIKANKKYGNKEIKHQIFPDKDISKFKKIKLRASGQDVYKTHIRDALANMITKDLPNTNYEAYRPSILFINGTYWGIYNIRESVGKDFIKNNYDIKSKDLDFLINDRDSKISGTSDDYSDFIEFLRGSNLSFLDNYNYALSKIDIDNYIDYMATNIYTGNSDWPGTNIYYFKEKKDGAKWRWLFHDMDFSFALYNSISDVNYNALQKAKAINGEDWPNPEWSTLLFRKLLENPTFKNKFKSRLNSLLDSTFSPAVVNNVIDKMATKIRPQITKHSEAWEENNYGETLTKALWEAEIQKLKDYANKRPAIVRGHLNNL